jgi:hypothetical protein
MDLSPEAAEKYIRAFCPATAKTTIENNAQRRAMEEMASTSAAWAKTVSMGDIISPAGVLAGLVGATIGYARGQQAGWHEGWEKADRGHLEMSNSCFKKAVKMLSNGR